MGIVHLFGERAVDPSKKAAGAANNNTTAEIVEVVFNTKPVKAVAAPPIFGQMRAMLVNTGIDFSCHHTQADFQLMTHLIQGIFDRQDGTVTKQSCIGAAFRYAMEAPSTDDTHDVFGDLLGKLD